MELRSDDERSIPLLSPRNDPQRRPRNWCNTTATISRWILRKRIKFYAIFLALFIILLLTILHKNSLHGNQSSSDPSAQAERRLLLRNRFEARTMKTIIGRYVGPNPAWSKMTAQDLSDSILNTNNYDPDPDMGKNGKPAYLPGYPKDQMKLLYSINRFNLAVSDKIPVDRKLPDPRKTACRKAKHDIHLLPKTSVIIVFHNEAWSTLVRTVHSILNTAPKLLLSEIILVDDASNRTFLNKSLDHYMNNLSSIRGVEIKVLRSLDRVGLIKARLIGVDAAIGDVLTFMDAHCETTVGWLEPLLEQIHKDRKSAACPVIDIINEDNFAFTRSFELHLGAMNWNLNFRWYPISRRELVESNGYNGSKVKSFELVKPFKTPVMAGGVFSIGRNYFNQIGRYDDQMDIWGGENIELSLRIWQCGGQITIVPCSHVAHIFRKSSPYTFRPGKEVSDILYSNLARVAEVWMDDWRHFFYALNPIVNRTIRRVGKDVVLKNINERHRLRKDLECKDFSWFLDNVWPENFYPKSSRFFGKIQNQSSRKCIQRPTVKIGSGVASVGAVETTDCSDKMVGQQMFVFDANTGFIMTDENICLDSGSDPIPTRQVILAPCSESARQRWVHTGEHQLKHNQSGLCLDSPHESRIQLESCSSNKEALRWALIKVDWSPKGSSS